MPQKLDVFRCTDPERFTELFQFILAHAPDAYADREKMCAAASTGTSFFLILNDVKEIVGFYSLAECGQDTLTIPYFSAEPLTGPIAEFALSFLIGQTGDAGYQKLQLTILEEDAKKLRFFREHGFKLAGSAESAAGTLLLQRKLQ